MIKTSLSIDRSHTHGKTLRPTPSIVNIYSIDMTKYEEGFSAESNIMPDPFRGPRINCWTTFVGSLGGGGPGKLLTKTPVGQIYCPAVPMTTVTVITTDVSRSYATHTSSTFSPR